MTRWPAVVTKWHRPPSAGAIFAEVGADDFGPLSGTFSPENCVAVAVAGAFVLGALLTYYVELSWQPVARPVTADAPAVP